MADTQKKSANQQLEEKMFMKRESSWLKYSAAEQKSVFQFCEDYKDFMRQSKTERLCAKNIISALEKNGFRNVETVKGIKTNDKIYKVIKKKTVIAAVIGKNTGCFRIVGSHMDSPRLDLKPTPLYQDSELALLQTHYYGGIKKYHWVNTPLELHGVMFTKDGKEVEIRIGDKEDDPKFIVPDLLPHLAREQMKKEAAKIIEGENLNIICGHMPVNDKDIKDKIKFSVMKYLHENYGIIEEDFNCAELELVPAGNPIDIGLDRALVGAYGQDDKVCAYTSMRAILEVNNPAHTAVTLFVDKEETGSMGDTGAESMLLEHFARDYTALVKTEVSPEKILETSKAISADVTAAMDPNFPSVNDPQNVSYVGKGVSIEKYGGSRGKSMTNDAHAEYMQYMRVLADKHDIPWQTGELGKIDIGGGGTIAMFMSRYGMDCVDAGPCLLGMHATCEVASKADVYSAFKLYKAFLED